jgi:hypothetical protein
MRRRDLLGACALGLSSTLAGCPGGDSTGEGPTGSRPPPPTRDTPPDQLLPTVPEGWILVERTDPSPIPVEAEAAVGANYESPDGETYTLRVYRWASNGEARNGFDEFANWTAYVVLGNFSFLVRGENDDAAYELLGASPAFSESFARDNNLFE